MSGTRILCSSNANSILLEPKYYTFGAQEAYIYKARKCLLLLFRYIIINQ